MKDSAAPLSPDLLLQAYQVGVFPMSEGRNDPEVFWVDPRMRGIFPLNGFHISRSLAKTLRSGRFNISANTAFYQVMQGCADRDETWINDTILALYSELHDRGYAHSIEVWDEQTLVGGVYGVAIGGAFFGESMFSRQANASKVALAYLVDRLRMGGFGLFDTQFITPHLASLGAIEIPRPEFHQLLEKALVTTANFNSPGAIPPVQDIMQRNAQMS